MRDKVFSKKEFIASVTENVKTMYRKTLKEATQQEIYQAVSLAVKRCKYGIRLKENTN